LGILVKHAHVSVIFIVIKMIFANSLQKYIIIHYIILENWIILSWTNQTIGNAINVIMIII